MKIYDDDIVLKIALSMIKGITPDFIRHMYEADVTPRDFFEKPFSEIAPAIGINLNFSIDQYFKDEALANARKEKDFIDRHNIRAYFLTDDDYPWRMADIADPPKILYQIGSTDLNFHHSVSIVGTRRATPYGLDFCRKLTSELAGYFSDICIVSGLAFGVDAAAHAAAIENNAMTVAVVAHGLNTIYPAANRDLAKRIISSGGSIISEYPSGTTPFRKHFLERNRIIAALSDASVIAESEIKGGAMSTANYAFGYNRDVFALPGRINDPISAGCNHLIRRQKANLITSAADLIETLGWQPLGLKVEPKMRSLFPELDGDSKRIFDHLRYSHDPVTLDILHQTLSIPMSTLMVLLSDLEFDGIILKHPGNRYTIAT